MVSSAEEMGMGQKQPETILPLLLSLLKTGIFHLKYQPGFEEEWEKVAGGASC